MLRAIISEPCAPSSRYGAHHHLGIRTFVCPNLTLRLVAHNDSRRSGKRAVPTCPHAALESQMR
ncbi:hypothetical protein J2R76_003950 [Bradyrhizobium sp. USDA 4532]|nr:hypothetical protein [Bradyrhizobium sp. USDA 4545]MCP1920359.1 hypothetical protein [Bradyrhizobium sp. USDA 4532]